MSLLDSLRKDHPLKVGDKLGDKTVTKIGYCGLDHVPVFELDNDMLTRAVAEDVLFYVREWRALQQKIKCYPPKQYTVQVKLNAPAGATYTDVLDWVLSRLEKHTYGVDGILGDTPPTIEDESLDLQPYCD